MKGIQALLPNADADRHPPRSRPPHCVDSVDGDAALQLTSEHRALGEEQSL
jgi:hypothetical protein